MSAQPTRALELVVEPASDAYDPDDERWRDQVSALLTELHAQTDVESRAAVHAAGTKGVSAEIILALGTAGTFTATVECFRAWLGRDRSRRIDIRWDDNGTERFVSLSGDGIDGEGVRDIARAAAARVGGSGWPADTGPS